MAFQGPKLTSPGRAGLAAVAAALTLSLTGLGVARPPESQVPATVAGVLPESYPWPRLVETLTPAVVNVRTTVGQAAKSDAPSPQEMLPEQFRRFLPPELRERLPELPRQRRGLGTGVIIDPKGLIVTNHHVIDGAQSVQVTLSDGRQLTGKVIGTDPETDLALLKVEATDLPAVRFGSSAELQVGEPIMAIGNPFGLDHTVTVGVVSGKSRVIGAGRYDDFLQTDAAINPGNSGGPIVNTRGEVVGIATAIASRSGGFQGIGFAIPIDLARPVLAQLQKDGRVTRGWLGVTIQPLTAELAESFRLKDRDGALIASVTDGSPAEKAGIRPGDVIVRYQGAVVDNPRELSLLVANTKIGDTVTVQVIRDGRSQSLQVTIADLNAAPDRQARAGAPAPRGTRRLGLGVEPVTPELARRFSIQPGTGVVVTDVNPDSPAARAGIAEGDVIREINRIPVESVQDVQKGLDKGGPSDDVVLRVERRGAARYVVVDVS